MISRIDLRGAGPGQLSRTALAGVLPKAVADVEAAATVIRPRAGGVPSTKGVL